MRIVFMGTPEFSVPTLQALAARFDVIACYTQPPRPGGRRGLENVKSPVHIAADHLGIAVYHPKSLKGEIEQAEFAAHNADVAVVVAYGLLLPQAILNALALGCYNGHASLLPRWRGAAPIHRAIMAGDTKTGMMIMKMDAGLDTGPVALTGEIAIDAEMTTGQLHDALSHMGADLMVEAMTRLEVGNLPLKAQAQVGVTYANKIDKSEARIDWSKTAHEVDSHIRGLSPFPGAWCEMEIGGKWERVKLLASRMGDNLMGQAGMPIVQGTRFQIVTGAGAVELTRLQRAGAKPMDATQFLRGASVTFVR